MLSVNILNEPLPYPLPKSEYALPEETDEIHEYKDHTWRLFGYKDQLSVPQSVGEYVLLLFLDVKDIIRLSIVSKRMREICLRSLRFKDKWIFQNLPRFTTSDLNLICERAGFFRAQKLIIDNCSKFSSSGKLNDKSSEFLFNLTSLSLFGNNMESQIIFDILQNCSCLRELKTDQLCDSLINRCLEQPDGKKLNLDAIFLDYCHDLTDEGFMNLAEILQLHQNRDIVSQKLSLSFNHMAKISTEGMVSLSRALAASAHKSKKATTMLSLDIQNCDFFNDECAEQVFRVLSNCDKIKMSSLALDTGPLHSKVFNHLKPECIKLLQVSSLNFCGDHNLFKVMENVSFQQQIEEFSLENPVDLKLLNISSVFSFSNIKTLKLSNAGAAVDDNFLKMFAKSCRKLKCLDISSCHLVSDEGLRSLLFSCRSIENIFLARCELISDQTVFIIAKTLAQKLRRLSIFCCFRVSSAGMDALTNFCPNVEFLDVSWCFRISGKSLIELAVSCRKLKKLVMEGCSHVSALEKDNIAHLSYRLSCKDFARVVTRRKSKSKQKPKLRRRKSTSSVLPHNELGFTYAPPAEVNSSRSLQGPESLRKGKMRGKSFVFARNNNEIEEEWFDEASYGSVGYLSDNESEQQLHKVHFGSLEEKGTMLDEIERRRSLFRVSH